ncbi:MAG TPA: hypothetical protein VFE36_13215 [Candidatus Baltobacteraceae bacterium]|nr:hypothetical protein [Candidatus Baltobacteraceae bacterium]
MRSLLIALVFVGLAAPAAVLASDAPPLTKVEAATIIAHSPAIKFAKSCLPATINEPKQEGKWAAVTAHCLSNPNDARYSYFLYHDGVWHMSCVHGVNVYDVKFLVSTCDMTQGEASLFK